MDHITTGLLQFTSLQWSISGSLNRGGRPMFGSALTRRRDGGGLWQASGEVILTSDADILLWEALVTDWNLGNNGVIVHRNAGPLLLSNGSVLVPFGDGSMFGDGTELVSSDVTATLVDTVAAGDVTYRVRVVAPRAIVGGEPFTMEGPTYLARLHSTARILATEADGEATIYTLRAGPPATEDHTAGTEVDFNRPRCFMRVEVSPDLWPVYEGGFIGARIPVTFTESMDVAP